MMHSLFAAVLLVTSNSLDVRDRVGVLRGTGGGVTAPLDVAVRRLTKKWPGDKARSNSFFFGGTKLSSSTHQGMVNETEGSKYEFLWAKAEVDFTRLRGSLWPKLDQFVDTLISNQSALMGHSSRLSGGVAQLQRQPHILLAITTALLRQVIMVKSLATSRFRVCETGFGAGHSVVLWWSAATRAMQMREAAYNNLGLKVISFDLLRRVYQPSAVDWLREKLYNTPMTELVSIEGNSCETVPDFFATNPHHCHILHGSSLCPSDNIDLVLSAAGCGSILTATAMDDLQNEVYFLNSASEEDELQYIPKKQGQWLWLARNGCIAEVSCYKEPSITLQRDYVYAKSGTTHEQRFCVALVTAGCQVLDANTKHAHVGRKEWSQGYGRVITRDVEARSACMNSPDYAKRYSLMSAVAEHYQSFLVQLGEDVTRTRG